MHHDIQWRMIDGTLEQYARGLQISFLLMNFGQHLQRCPPIRADSQGLFQSAFLRRLITQEAVSFGDFQPYSG